MKRYTTLALALAVFLFASFASALPMPPKGDFKRLDKLEQTAYGASLGVEGYLQCSRGNGVEQFGVRLFTDRIDINSQYFIVEVTNELGTFEAGVIKMFVGSGDLQLVDSRDASVVFPLPGVSRVVVRDKNDVVLEIDF